MPAADIVLVSLVSVALLLLVVVVTRAGREASG